MLLALAAELLGVPVLWAVPVPLVLAAGFVVQRVGRTRGEAHTASAAVEPERTPRDELAWLALGVPTQPFFDSERTAA